MLRLIVIEGDKSYESNHKLTPVKYQTHHIIEMLMYCLPKLDLDGSTKLTIKFADRPENENVYNRKHLFGVSWYYVGTKKIQTQKAGQDRDLAYLKTVCDVLKEIAQINDCDKSVVKHIDDAMNKVRELNFLLTIPINRLSKTSKDRKYKASVIRTLCPQGEKWQIEIRQKNGILLQGNLSKDFVFLSQKDFYSKAEWSENKYVIYERLGKVVAIAVPDEKSLQLYSFKGLREVIKLTEVQHTFL